MEKASIESDYRLAKILGITHQSVSLYRTGDTLPNDKVIAQLCALSGDDPGVIAAEIHAARSKSPEAKSMWMSIAARLSGGASPAILAVVFAISLVALIPNVAEADDLATLSAVVYQQPIHRIK